MKVMRIAAFQCVLLPFSSMYCSNSVSLFHTGPKKTPFCVPMDVLWAKDDLLSEGGQSLNSTR